MRKSKQEIDHCIDELEEYNPREASVAEYLSATDVEHVNRARGLVRIDGELRGLPAAVREVVL